MSAESMWSIDARERYAVRHALATERACVRRCREALADAQDRRSRLHWNRRLRSSVERAARLALALIDMGEAVPMGNVATEWDGDLLDAMDALRRGNGWSMPEAIPARRAVRGRPVGNPRQRMVAEPRA